MVALARIAQARTGNGRFAPRHLDALFDEIGLPRPHSTSYILAGLDGSDLSRAPGHGQVWTLTPAGRARSELLLSDLDVAALLAEAARTGGSFLAGLVHTVVPPALAAPDLLLPLREFLQHHPFERNVFGMTRFPENTDDDPDPVAPALLAARAICTSHGLEFHLASDRAMNDDLWRNVAGHMWASKYGIAFFEDRRNRGVNYNLTIEVGAMLMTGRRLALLKDTSIDRMPTDLVGRIYKSVDLDAIDTVNAALHSWIRDDLGLTACAECPPPVGAMA